MMKRHKSLLAGALTSLAAVSVLGVAGCANSASGGGESSHIDANNAFSYSTLGQLRRAATSVVVVQPTGAATQAKVGGVPWTISTVQVVRQVSGQKLPSAFGLRQLGSAATAQDSPVVAKGNLYLAYLQQFKTLAGRVAGQYVVIGGLQGLYQSADPGAGAAAANDSVKSFTRVSPDSAGLPRNISIQEAMQS
jgi:hypothetical protein